MSDDATAGAGIKGVAIRYARVVAGRAGRLLCGLILVVGVLSPALAQTGIDPNDGAAWCAIGKTGGDGAVSVPASKAARRWASHASAAFDATYYHLVLDLDPDRDPILRGVVSVTGRVSEALSVLDLDLSDNLTVDDVRGEEGGTLVYSHGGHTLSTVLPSPAGPGDRVTITVAYEGNPMNTGFGTFEHGLVNGDPYVWTLSEPYGAREWWPNVDHPSDKADSVRVTVRVPEPLRVGSNGLLVREASNGDGTATYEWLHRYPIASYLVSIAAGRYDVYEQTYVRPGRLAQEWGPLSLPVLHYAYAGTDVFQGTGGQSGWNKVVDVLPLFEDWFGPYPFAAEKYGHAHTTFGGGMEHQTMSSMGGNGWGLVAHELAHMWFGDMITNRTWPHLWLHEGFATMAELLFWQSDPAANGSTYATIFNLYYDRALTAEGTLVLQDTTQVGRMFSHARVYSKGGMVLHMLRAMVGDDVFKQILRTFAADPAVQYGTAVTADFERVASDVSGRDLSTFFRQWVTEGTGYPGYEAFWASSPTDTGPGVHLELRQTQDASQSNVSVFEMPVDVRVVTRSGDQLFTLENTLRVQAYDLPLDAEPVRVEVDPHRSILRDPELPVTRGAGPTAFDWNLYPNPARGFVRLRIDLIDPTEVTVRIFDAGGRRIAAYALGRLAAGAFVRTLDLPAGLASGMYTVEVSTDEREVSEMIAVIR